jgi:hypothetical protein
MTKKTRVTHIDRHVEDIADLVDNGLERHDDRSPSNVRLYVRVGSDCY